MSIPEFSTQTGPDFDVGGPCDVLRVGDSFERTFGWDKPKVDPETGEDTCDWEPVDFTGYSPVAELLDKDDNVLLSLDVTPNPGDDTGDFTYIMTPAQNTQAIADAVVRWTSRITAGSVTKTLFYARFNIT